MNRDLISHGWLAWDDIRTQLAGASALWLEPTGYRFGPLPDSQPPTTRIHAWAGQRCWRLIPDRGRALLTELAPPGERQARTCEVQVTEVVAWQPEYAGPVPAGLPRLVRMEITDLRRTGIFSSISFLSRPPTGP